MARKKKSIAGVVIHGIADKGKAVGKSPEGEIVFIDGAVPGDVVDVLILRKKKGVGFGIVTNFVSYSKDRIDPFCKHFNECGGCKWQNLKYETQCFHKSKNVNDAMVRIAKIESDIIEPIVAAKDIKHYRNKLEYSFSNKRWLTKEEIESEEEINRAPALGFHISGAFDKVLDIEECFLQDDKTNTIRNFIRKFCFAHEITFFDPRAHTGFMRNVIVRNTRQGDWMIILSVHKKDQKTINMICDAMIENLPFITSLYYVVNYKKNDFILDLDFHLYHGKEYMVETLKDVKYKIGPKSFFQTNPQQAEALFDVVVDFADFQGTENVYDLYTGLGSIALYLAGKVKTITGIEEIPEAIEDAKINAEFNNITNCTFYAGDVKDVLEEGFINRHGKPDIVITDPPRAGMHASVVETLLALEAPKIVYVSCNPGTQARDLLLLKEKYEVIKVRPVDMFPHTYHIENVALLKLK